jgi:hypothetical protein
VLSVDGKMRLVTKVKLSKPIYQLWNLTVILFLNFMTLWDDAGTSVR